MAKENTKTIVYSALEVANICGVVNQTAINWIRNGHLKAFSTPGGQYRVYLDDLIAFMNERGMRVPADLLAAYEDCLPVKQTVLIVDDDRGLNAVLTRYIEKNFANIEVYQAFDGFEAGSKMVEKKPTFVLLDLNLPGVDGFELCTRLKQTDDFNKPFVIVMTALEDADIDQRVAKIGADLFFKKPINLKDIAASLQSILDKK